MIGSGATGVEATPAKNARMGQPSQKKSKRGSLLREPFLPQGKPAHVFDFVVEGVRKKKPGRPPLAGRLRSG